MELEMKIDLLVAQLSAVTGSQGMEILHEMGDAAANSYLGGCLALAHECRALAIATPAGDACP